MLLLPDHPGLDGPDHGPDPAGQRAQKPRGPYGLAQEKHLRIRE